MKKNKSYVIFAFLFLSTIFLFGQDEVTIDGLIGPGQSPVLVNSSGELSRAKKFDTSEEYSISPVDFRNHPSPIRDVSPSEFYAPIHLPDETKMRSVTFWYEDNTPPNLVVEIYRGRNTERTLIMSEQVSGTPGVPTSVTVDLGVTPVALINNEDYFYYMRIVCVENSSIVRWPQELVFYRAIITYEY